LLGSAELIIAAPSGWQHSFTAFDYLYRYNDVNLNGDPARVSPVYGPIDFPDHEYDHINRVGAEYQGDYSERAWGPHTFGYRIENENGVVGDLDFPPSPSGQRLNQDSYLQQLLTLGRLSAVGWRPFRSQQRVRQYRRAPRGADFAGAARRRNFLRHPLCASPTPTGFKEPRLEENIVPDRPIPFPIPDSSRSASAPSKAGIQQDFSCMENMSYNATYFNNLFS